MQIRKFEKAWNLSIFYCILFANFLRSLESWESEELKNRHRVRRWEKAIIIKLIWKCVLVILGLFYGDHVVRKNRRILFISLTIPDIFPIVNSIFGLSKVQQSQSCADVMIPLDHFWSRCCHDDRNLKLSASQFILNGFILPHHNELWKIFEIFPCWINYSFLDITWIFCSFQIKKCHSTAPFVRKEMLVALITTQLCWDDAVICSIRWVISEFSKNYFDLSEKDHFCLTELYKYMVEAIQDLSNLPHKSF